MDVLFQSNFTYAEKCLQTHCEAVGEVSRGLTSQRPGYSGGLRKCSSTLRRATITRNYPLPPSARRRLTVAARGLPPDIPKLFS